ncbi:hypothetical protein JTB14_011564 [Gonioctena quinquepunctata]|nr:hypothetical protein JTB14_011564 [Gonioctena quinquepunctata]
MYRKILLENSQLNYQIILWRFSPDVPIEYYNLTTSVHGVSSSFCIALRILHQLAEDEGQHFPKASLGIKQNSNRDDSVCTVSSPSEARILRLELVQLLQKSGFDSRKWSGNEHSLLSD